VQPVLGWVVIWCVGLGLATKMDISGLSTGQGVRLTPGPMSLCLPLYPHQLLSITLLYPVPIAETMCSRPCTGFSLRTFRLVVFSDNFLLRQENLVTSLQNKKAQLSLTNPRDACEKFARFT